MGKAASFSTDRFTAEGGYIVTAIDGADSPAFDAFLDKLARRPDRPVDIGLQKGVRSGDLEEILAQLNQEPVNNGIKQIDVRGVTSLIDYAEPRDGFRDHWVVGDRDGGRLRGSREDDVVLANAGADRVFAGPGEDFLAGARGNDTISGGDGDDILSGGPNHDVLHGKDNNDVIRGGGGHDIMFGGSGADAFIFTRQDFRFNMNRDIIKDFDRDEGDQIVDPTGQLEVVASGRIEIFGGRGTLIEHAERGDQVFVQGAFLSQKDIQGRYREPPEGVGDGNQVVRESDVIELRVQPSGSFDNGEARVDIFSVFVRNKTDETIANLEELPVRLEKAGKLDIDEEETQDATFRKGVFRLDEGQERTVGPNAETELFTFYVTDRPNDVQIQNDDVVPLDFTPRNADGEEVERGIGFRLRVRTSDEFDGGATAEVFIRNIGEGELRNLENMEFAFDERQVNKVDSVWGADFFDRKFAVEPWEGDERPPLGPDDGTKLFGFTYETRSDTKAPVVDGADFELVSDFDDLLA